MSWTKGCPKVLTIALAALLAAVGCGGGKQVGGQGAQAAKPIVIGASISQTGSYSASAKYALEGFELWVEQVNARGGLLGRPVKMATIDDKSDPKTAVQLYEKLITQDKVDMIVGPFSSGITAAVSGVAEKYKMVMLAPESSDSNTFARQENKYSIQGITTADQYFNGALDIAKSKGYKRVVALGEDTAFPKTALAALKVKAPQYGLELLMSEFYPKGASDFSALLIRAKQLNPDVILGASYLPDSQGIIRQAKELGLNPKMFSFSVGPAEAEWKNLGSTGDFVFGSTQWDKSLKTKGNPEFVATYTKKFGREPDYHSASNYASLEVLEAAVKKVGSFDQDKLLEAIKSTEVDTVFGRFKVDGKGVQIGYSAFLLQWQAGKQVLVWPDNAAVGKYIVPTPPWSERK